LSFADEISAKFSLAWDQLGVEPNDLIRTTEERHKKAVEIFLTQLMQSGKVYAGEYEGLYCVGHEAFIKESELVNGMCPEHKTVPQKIKEKNWFFKLSNFASPVKEKIEKNEFVILPEERKNEVLSFINQGLEDIAISRPNVKWGIPIPWDQQQTAYVWIEALFNYCTAVGYGADNEKFKRLWPADLHIMAKDIIKFHCIIWPALLLAVDLPLPKKVFAHGFFTVGGEKMSKSIGNVIDPTEWSAKYGSDAVRYFLLREVPFGQDGDVSEEKLKARYEGELANGLGNLVSRLTTLIEKHLAGKVTIDTSIFPNDEGVAKNIENFHFHDALAIIWQWVAFCNKTVDENKLWELGKTDIKKFSEFANTLSSSLVFTAQTLKPFMPETSEKILQIFQAKKITKSEPLFPRIS